MKIPAFWVKERRMIAGRQVRLRGVSPDSQKEAEQRLEQRAQLWQRYLSSPGSMPLEQFCAELRRLDDCREPYSAAILEPVEQQVDSADIVTRNRYGCLVLNSVSLCFADVDCYRRGLWARIFPNPAREQRQLTAAIRSLCEQSLELSARLYRTAHGWRVMLREPGLTVGSARELELFTALQADPLYVKLCRRQLCWRARLSPKPFHRGLKRYPMPDSALQRADEWIAAYEVATHRLATCRLVETFGPPLRGEVVELHDTATRALTPDLELA